MTRDLNTLICLFHSRPHAHAALEDLLKAGIPELNITLIDNEGSQIAATASSLEELNVPARDRAHLLEGIQAGGAVLTVSALSDMAALVDAIFQAHSARKIDEAIVEDDMSGVDTLAAAAPGTLADTGTTTGTDTDTGEILLVEDDRTGTTYIYTVPPTAPATQTQDEDIDPRELGLDSRMAPIKTNTGT